MIAGRLCVSMLAALLVAGCGIDQGGVQGPGLPSGGTDAAAATTVVSGPITGFGSVLVNDLTLDASTAQILIDGRFATEADLAIGQVIRAVAVADNGRLRAVSIEHDENLIGPIDAIDSLDAAGGTLSVLGQPVIVDADTRFASALTATDLQPDDTIVVSGLTLPSGAIQATFIRRAAPAEALQITAAISGVDASNLAFAIGTLTIDYSQALLLELLTGVPELGLVVEVKGTALADGVLRASEVRLRPSLPGLFTAAATSLTSFESPLVGAATQSGALAVNFVGYVTASNLPGSVSLADVDVLIDAATLVDGGTAADLTVGAKVRVEGSVVVAGRVRATRIKVF